MTVENKKTSLHFYWNDKTERFYSIQNKAANTENSQTPVFFI